MDGEIDGLSASPTLETTRRASRQRVINDAHASTPSYVNAGLICDRGASGEVHAK